ncbi:MAG: right-handed parallel beta-helix repeat-containing protein [bacterium]
MRYLVVLLALALIVPATVAKTLQSAYDEAGPAEGYDKLLVLDSKVTYTGGLSVLQGKKSCIRGNGALCDLDGGQIFVSQPRTQFDITGCCIIDGGAAGAIYVADDATANIDGNTICKSGVGLYIWAYSYATVKNNIIFKNNKSGGSMYGIAKHQYTGTLNILYNDTDSNYGGNYMYFCPG